MDWLAWEVCRILNHHLLLILHSVLTKQTLRPFRATHRSYWAFTRQVTAYSSCSHWSQSSAEFSTQLEDIRWEVHKPIANINDVSGNKMFESTQLQELQVLHITSSIPITAHKITNGTHNLRQSRWNHLSTHGSRYPQHGQRSFFPFFPHQSWNTL